jgi:hypothetical protein
MVIASIFSFSDRVWDTLLILFVVIPLALLWGATLLHIVRRRDLARLSRLVWLVAVALFPIVGTFVYLVSQPSIRTIERLPGAALGQAADTTGALGAALDNFATTASLAQSSLVQGVELIEDLADMLARADSTLGFTVPFTRIRPLGPAHAEVRTLSAKSRALGRALGHTADALGTNVTDLRAIAGDVSALAGALGAATSSPAASLPTDETLRLESGPERSVVSDVSAIPVPSIATSGPVPPP